MLAIRLQRFGRKNEAAFRVVLTDSKNSSKSGRFKEVLGTYTIKNDNIQFKTDRIKHWISMGAKPSDTMHNALIKAGIIEGKKRNVLSKKSPTVKRKELKKKA
jgi:small subunit ribosomal protein S16